MARPRFETVEEYISSLPDGAQAPIRTVRQLILDEVPEAEELISYQIPAYRHRGWLLYVGAFTHHYTLFCPHAERLWTDLAGELAGLKIEKAKIKLPLDQPVPEALVRHVARHRAAENLEIEARK